MAMGTVCASSARLRAVTITVSRPGDLRDGRRLEHRRMRRSARATATATAPRTILRIVPSAAAIL